MKLLGFHSMTLHVLLLQFVYNIIRSISHQSSRKTTELWTQTVCCISLILTTISKYWELDRAHSLIFEEKLLIQNAGIQLRRFCSNKTQKCWFLAGSIRNHFLETVLCSLRTNRDWFEKVIVEVVIEWINAWRWYFSNLCQTVLANSNVYSMSVL